MLGFAATPACCLELAASTMSIANGPDWHTTDAVAYAHVAFQAVAPAAAGCWLQAVA